MKLTHLLVLVLLAALAGCEGRMEISSEVSSQPDAGYNVGNP